MAVGRSSTTGGFKTLWAASILVPSLIFAIAASWSWSEVKKEAQARIERTVDMLHEHALRSFETQEAILEAVDQRIRGYAPETIVDALELHEFLAGVIGRAQPSGGMVIVGPNNRLIGSSFAFPARQQIDVSDRDYVKALRGGHQGTYLGEVIVARPQNTTVFSISRRSSVGEMLLVSSFKPGYFEDFYASVAETTEDVVGLVRSDGALLARVPAPADVESYKNRFYDAAFEQVMAQGHLFSVGRSPVDGKERYYSFRRVGSYPVLVTYGLSASVLHDTWLRQLAISGAVALIAALLLMLFTHMAQRSVHREQAALASARLEAERRADAEARLRHSQRVDALGQIVGGVAHDFGNVVMAVMAGIRTLLKRAEDPAEVRRLAELVNAAADRGARLTQRMLTFARQEESRTESVEVEPALQSVSELLGHTLGSGYRVRLECPTELPKARGDRTEFETVIVNLVINARDAMPEGGTVLITAGKETVAMPGPSHAPGLQAGRYIRVAVHDQGIGMDAETLARVGEAFFTTKEPGKGTGLGLAMARGFVEQAGGSLRIDSDKGRGTTVTLWMALP